MHKAVLLSPYALPYPNIGSWTTMYNYFFQTNNNSLDIVICPEPKEPFSDIEYCYVDNLTLTQRAVSRFQKHYRFRQYWNHLRKLLNTYDTLIVNIVDNVRMLEAIHYYASQEKCRKRVKILFFMHGYEYVFSTEKKTKFYYMMDDLIVLTKKSYRHQLDMVHSIPCEVTQIHNGIDSKVFQPCDLQSKKAIRERLGLEDDTVYLLWLSQDRPKKGLHIVLEAWKALVDIHSDIELLLIGTNTEYNLPHVRTLGRIPNAELPAYYQAVDVYLFSSLCHEGWGMSLVEAMKSGTLCIASNIDPISEVTHDGEYACLVDNPNMVDAWIETINEQLNTYKKHGNAFRKNIPENLYDIDDWCQRINAVNLKWKARNESGGIG